MLTLTRLLSQTIRIRITEVDANGNLTIPALVNLLQEIAWNHSLQWKVSIYEMLPFQISWVMSRMKIVINQLPRHADEVVLDTWIQATDRYFCYRDFEMRFPDGTMLFKATSVWGVLDIDKRRVVAIPEWILEKNFVYADKTPLPPATGKLPTFDNPDFQRDFAIHWHDIDTNFHANNTCYFGWMIEALSPSFLQTNQLQEFSIVFRAESTLDDNIVSQAAEQAMTDDTQHGDTQSFLHKVLNDKGKELAQGKTVWRNYELS